MLVVAIFIITIILIVLFGELPTFVSGQKTIFIRFPNAPGVTVDTPVRKSGVLVGRVQEVKLLDDGGVQVTAKVDANRRLRRNETCRISTENVLGDAMLEFVPSGETGASTEQIEDGEYLDGVVASDPFDVMRVVVDLEEDMTQALGSIQGAGEEVGLVARNMNALLETNEEQFARVMTKSERALDQFSVAMTTVNEIIGDDEMRDRLRDALNQVPEVLQEASDLLVSLQRVSDRAENNLDNLEGLTGPLGEKGGEIVNAVERSVGRLDEVMAELVVFSRALNDSQGSLGQFVNNPDLYQKLNRAADNIEMVSRRLRPIVEDARVFTDKIARDPGRLGVKGALDRRRSGIK